MNESTVSTDHIRQAGCLDWTSCRTFARSLHELIARRAYEKWFLHGCPKGTNVQDWLEAEADVDTELEVRGKAGLICSALASHHHGAATGVARARSLLAAKGPEHIEVNEPPPA